MSQQDIRHRLSLHVPWENHIRHRLSSHVPWENHIRHRLSSHVPSENHIRHRLSLHVPYENLSHHHHHLVNHYGIHVAQMDWFCVSFLQSDHVHSQYLSTSL